MLSEIAKIDIRRHLSLPFAGLAQSGLTMGIRTLFEAGQLEFYMQNLQPAEESVLTGQPYGQVRLVGPVAAGQTITLTINVTPIVYTVTVLDAASSVPLQNVANGIAQAINLTNVGGVFAGGSAVLPPAPPAQLPAFAQVTLVAAVPFTLTASTTGVIASYVTAAGNVYPNPQYVKTNSDGTTTANYGYIALCNYAQNRIMVADSNFDTLSAGGRDGITLRPSEFKQRVVNYNYWRQLMGRVLSVSSDAWGFRGNNGSNQGGVSL